MAEETPPPPPKKKRCTDPGSIPGDQGEWPVSIQAPHPGDINKCGKRMSFLPKNGYF